MSTANPSASADATASVQTGDKRAKANKEAVSPGRQGSSQIGEAIVMAELALRGWIIRSLNAGTQSPNADLIAIKGRHRRTLQVKASMKVGNLLWVFLGGAGRAYFGTDKKFFNSSPRDIQSDFVVLVSYTEKLDWRVFVVPTAVAEKVARTSFDAVMKIKKRDGSQKQPIPHVWVCAEPEKKRALHKHEAAVAATLKNYENAWAALEQD